MEEKREEMNAEKPNFGIKRINKIKFVKNAEDDKKKNNDFITAFNGPAIVKTEFTLNAAFLLYCKILFMFS